MKDEENGEDDGDEDGEFHVRATTLVDPDPDEVVETAIAIAVAAGVVFYGLLAIFPAITALVSLYWLFAKLA
jgi:hypothetical protein